MKNKFIKQILELIGLILYQFIYAMASVLIVWIPLSIILLIVILLLKVLKYSL